jgi:hypothetical protein
MCCHVSPLVFVCLFMFMNTHYWCSFRNDSASCHTIPPAISKSQSEVTVAYASVSHTVDNTARQECEWSPGRPKSKDHEDFKSQEYEPIKPVYR